LTSSRTTIPASASGSIGTDYRVQVLVEYCITPHLGGSVMLGGSSLASPGTRSL
jgi:hypothetical protein